MYLKGDKSKPGTALVHASFCAASEENHWTDAVGFTSIVDPAVECTAAPWHFVDVSTFLWNTTVIVQLKGTGTQGAAPQLLLRRGTFLGRTY